MAAEPKNKRLYNYVKGLANKKFKSKSGVYRSSWIVREYKKRGGLYKNGKGSKSGLKRWYKERWVDLNRPIRNSKGKIVGYKSCGRPSVKKSKTKYPLCRPSKRISPKTPRTYKQISKRSLSRAKRQKSKVKGRNIKFGGSKLKSYEFHDTFIKACKCKDDKCKCDSKRESKKCMDGKCELVKVPEGKRQILESYYKQTGSDKQTGSYKQTGGKTYKCKLCNFTTSGKVNMLKHKLRHMGEKKYKCDRCEYTTHRKEKVDLHKMKQHGGMKGELDKIIKKRKKGTYTCPICMKNFGRNDHRLKHLRTIHKNDKTIKEIVDLDKWYKSSIKTDFKGVNSEDFSGGGAQYYGKRSSKMIKIPENVKKTARYAFKLKKLGFKGGIETGWKRAKQLANRDSIPIQDLKYMRAWFARHLYTSYPTYRKWKKAGRPKGKEWHNKRGIQAWLIWSGDAGFKWVNSTKNINALNKHYNKTYKKLKLRA